MWKWLVGFFVAAVLACGLGGYILGYSPTMREMVAGMRSGSAPLTVRFGTVELGDLTRTVSAPGQVEPRTNVKISSQVSARITALPFREGDSVRKGDVILRLESADLAALLESAQAQLRVEQARLEGARARLALAETDVKRQRDLASTNDIPRSVLDSSESEHLQAQSALHQTEQAIEIARAHILRAQKDLENAVVTAPIDGTITRLDAEVGETVVVGTLNNPGSVIMEIADLSTMLLKARVDEANVAPVRAGQRARVYVNAYPDRVFEGTVERVELLRKVDPTDRTGYFETEILMHLGEGDRLYSGLTGNAEIEVQTIRDVLKVPSQAVVDRRVDELPAEVRTSQWVDPKKAYARVVYAVTEAAPPADGAPAPAAGGGPGPSSPGQPGAGKGAKPAGPVYTVRPVPVSTGSSDLTHTVILGGVGQGERIIVGPYKALVELKPGQTVVEEPGGAPPSPAAPPAPAGGGAGS